MRPEEVQDAEAPGRKEKVGNPFYKRIFLVASLLLGAFLGVANSLAGDFSPLPRKSRTREAREEICEKYGGSLERKFASNPWELVEDLDALIVKVGSRGPDRVKPLGNGGRMLASIAEAPRQPEERNRLVKRPDFALEVRVSRKLTEANTFITQSKRRGFFDEDEERARGVQESCAKVIYERAVLLEKMTRK